MPPAYPWTATMRGIASMASRTSPGMNSVNSAEASAQSRPGPNVQR